MKKIIKYLLILLLVSCSNNSHNTGREVITVSIAPFSYFVNAIGGGDFDVNIMVPASADAHVYEPVPGQITSLSRSVAYISDGYLGFEITWLDRFYKANPLMKKVSLGSGIDLIRADNGHTFGAENADPHFWVSPRSAFSMASAVKELLCSLRPQDSARYSKNYLELRARIAMLDRKADSLFKGFKGKTFMIFHPSLGYIARDYDLVQLAVENEGKEPSPSYMKKLIDEAREKNIKLIFIQKGFDTKNAGAIASETGAELMAIDPMGGNWPEEVSAIIDAIHESLVKSSS